MDCQLCDLSHLGHIAVSGADAEKFLQGQCTNDLRQLTNQHSQLGSHCNPQGRMLAVFRLIRQDDTIYLQLPISNLLPLLERLTKYRLRARMAIHDASAQLVAIGLAGADAPQMLATAIFANNMVENAITLEQPNQVIQHHPYTLVQLGAEPRFQVLGQVAPMQTLWTHLLTHGANPVGVDAWTLLDIRAGIPTLYPATVGAFIPQMLNLHLLDGVSFSKGCYTGQEVIARLQHLGALKRRLFRVEVTTPNQPLPGDELHSDVSESGQGAGRVVEAAPSAEGCHELLVVAEIDAVQRGTVRLKDNAGALVRFLTLPYACPM